MEDAPKTGRPSLRTPLLVEELINWLSEGKVLTEFCRQPGKPAWRTIYGWMDADAELSAAIARARDVGADAIAEEALKIADTPQEGVTVTTDDRGTKQVSGDMLGHRKLQVETRLKLLAKWNPKKYGERIRNELTGADGAPIQYEDARERNIGLIETLSTRFTGATPGEAAPEAADESDPESDAGANT